MASTVKQVKVRHHKAVWATPDEAGLGAIGQGGLVSAARVKSWRGRAVMEWHATASIGFVR